MNRMEKEFIITIFGSSKPQPEDVEYKIAYDLGNMLAQAGFVICNGGYGGIMEASAKGARENGGKTIGVVTEHFKRAANSFVDEVVKVKSLIDRLLELIELGDAYVILKGSTGTLVELSLVWEYINKKVMKEKPIIIIGDFWKLVVQTLKAELIHEGLEDVTKFVTIVKSPKECVDLLNKRFTMSATFKGKLR
jgi:uncharacterized protein (TIGR00725 family)